MVNHTPQTLTSLLATLEENKLRPNKKLSQNFLIDKNVIHKILSFADIQPTDTVLEIGPGAGALTKELLTSQAQVIAIEKDRGLFNLLTKSLIFNNLTLIEDDFLKCDLEQLLLNKNNVKVVANIPYHITSPIIDKLTQILNKITSITLMIQKEMAERLLAQPGPSNSAFALFVQSYFDVKYLFTVSKNCYYPKPDVTSAVVQLKPKNLEKAPPRQFQAFVKKLFQKRRKMLRSSFSINDLSAVGIHETARPEELSLHKALNLFHLSTQL